MSAGGQNSSTVSGIQGMRIKDTSDFVAQARVRQIYQLFNSNAPTAVRPRIRNGNDYYLQYLQGIKEVSSNVNGNSSCTTCAGLTYNGNVQSDPTKFVLTFKNGNYPPV
jgi:predicted transcriptional regulator